MLENAKKEWLQTVCKPSWYQNKHHNKVNITADTIVSTYNP